MKVVILYTCNGCGLKDIPLEVEQRGANEDVAHWVEGLRGQIGYNHTHRSPWCTSRACDLKVPVPPGNSARIGDPTAH